MKGEAAATNLAPEVILACTPATDVVSAANVMRSEVIVCWEATP